MTPKWSACLIVAIGLSCATRAFADEPLRSPEPAANVAAPLPSRDVRWSATLGGAVDAGSLPRAAPGLALGFDVRRGALSARVAGAAFLPQLDRSSGASVALFDVMAMVCALAPIGSRFDVGMCGGAGIGLLRAVAAPSAPPDSSLGVRPQGEAISRLDVTLLPGLLVSLEAGVVIDPLRSPMPLTASDAYRSSLFSFRGALALHVRFW
jgi:hypothetical protein